uniref:Uncharacterized protein n=1 Tax=Arundo donax TaxID=35708 RepID=A0A0A9CAP8_ARUDO
MCTSGGNPGVTMHNLTKGFSRLPRCYPII